MKTLNFCTLKVSFLIAVMSLVTYTGFSQDKVQNDPSYSAYNYKHPNKAAYAKKHNLDNPATLGQIEVVQAENYKQSYKRTVWRKAGVISRYDKFKVYPNYKRQGQ